MGLWHRWAGLVLAGFLTMVGLTGALIAWNDALERVCAPRLFVLAPDRAVLPALDPFVLRRMAERQGGAAANLVSLDRRADAPALFYLTPADGRAAPANDEIALDPASGAVLGARRYGDLHQGVINLMPFIYRLHESLALDHVGTLVMGIVALGWTVDCVAGAWLTLPARARVRRAPGAWLRLWRRAWLLRRGRWPRVNFDLHRAFGLWLWGMLFVLAWSGVAFNLPAVYRAAMAPLGMQLQQSPKPAKLHAPALDFPAARAAAQAAMARLAVSHGFAVRRERLIWFDPATSSYQYRVLSTLDPGHLGRTQVTIDADDGHVVGSVLPTGMRAGDTVTSWIEEVHTAGLWRPVLQLALSLTGVAVAVLSVTGVVIWWRKRRARRWAAQ